MKKIFLTFVTGFIPLLIFVSTAYSQNQKKNFVITDADSFQMAHNDVAPPPPVPFNEAGVVNSRAIKFFNKEFKNAEAVKWHTLKDGFVAYCTVNGIKNKVFYDKKGRWNGNIIFYNDKTMPRDIRAIVKSTYYDYRINLAQEIHVADKIVYRVYLEDETSWKTVNIIEGEMTVIEDFKKQ